MGDTEPQVQHVWDGVMWNVAFLCQLVNYEMFNKIAHSRVHLREGHDVLSWQHTVDGKFSTKSAWQLVRIHGDVCPWKTWLWQDHVLKKMSFLCWGAQQNAIPVDESIQQLGIPIASKCHCCVSSKGESLDHVFCDGEGPRKVWDFFAAIFGI